MTRTDTVIDQLKQLVISPDQSAENRSRVYDMVLGKSIRINRANFIGFATSDLKLIVDCYDQMLLGGAIEELLLLRGARLSFQINNRLRTSAGRLVTRKLPGGTKEYRLESSASMFFRSFSEEYQGPFTVNGLLARDRLSALIIVMEHETLHLVEELMFHQTSCSRNRFRRLAFAWFGHTESTHALLTPREEARRQGIHVGDQVRFHFQNRDYCGLVNRVTRRATILVPCEGGEGELYNDGMSYQKFYVPLTLLEKVDGPPDESE